MALQAGTLAAITTAVGAFLVYNYLFVDPRHTFAVGDPGEWLNLLLLLFVGVVVGPPRRRPAGAGRLGRRARARGTRAVPIEPDDGPRADR